VSKILTHCTWLKMDISHRKTWENLPFVTKARDFLACSFCKTSMIFGPWNAIFLKACICVVVVLVYSIQRQRLQLQWYLLLNDNNEWIGRKHKGYKGRLAVEERYAFIFILFHMHIDYEVWSVSCIYSYILNRFCPRELIAHFIH